MDYNRRLYEATAYLLMLQHQSKDYDYNVVVSRYIYDSGGEWQDNIVRFVDSVALLLSLERYGEPMSAETIDRLELNIAELSPKDFPERDRDCVESDLETARCVIEWYRTTPNKLM